MEIKSFLKEGSVYLDTNVFIYALEDFPEYAVCIRGIFESIDLGIVAAFTSEFALSEALVKPFMLEDESLVALYKDFLSESPFLSVKTVTRQILISAASIRAKSVSRISLADAIHLATAKVAGCHIFLTNDNRLLRQNIDNLEIILLKSFL